ncbi:hypothetical protein KPSA1_02840 [Pseudomonas syringae pv. actinidiae]|uniref:Uncharacterized protein n=1 Tax=Pseudomonas syringae pv. actinidiae TaxID=103796 RepID=A0A2V0Q9G1_PSESF|nr:hypothetical protein KPSA1_02840 [Pseudomonas syringae pv. actinidiae]
MKACYDWRDKCQIVDIRELKIFFSNQTICYLYSASTKLKQFKHRWAPYQMV